jgi:hypothetical protein
MQVPFSVVTNELSEQAVQKSIDSEQALQLFEHFRHSCFAWSLMKPIGHSVEQTPASAINEKPCLQEVQKSLWFGLQAVQKS